KAEDAERNIQLDAAAMPEEFDEFEINGIPSTCQDCDPQVFPAVYPPMFSAAIPWNNAAQNDKFASDNLYANAFQMAFYNLKVDLGSPEVRDLMKPDNCLSTASMPFQPKLPPLSIQVGLVSKQVSVNGARLSAMKLSTKSGGSAAPAGGTASNSRMAAIPVINLGVSVITASQPRLVWKHDNYIYADYSLLHQFAGNFLANQQNTMYVPFVGTLPVALEQALAYGNDVTLAAGEYGSITMDPASYTVRYNDPDLARIANALYGVSFQPLPPSSHTLQLIYNYPFCSGCSLGIKVQESFNFGIVMPVPVRKTMTLTR
ncbi:MAG TPA: hypothetical protein VKU83_06180, partial [Puia sp.]|nr:hypothetical protein [Puia sp.]